METITTFGALHMAWNNAGILGAFQSIQDMTLDDFDTVMATNSRGVFACLKYEIAAMRNKGTPGAIVNTSSWTAHGSMPGLAAYAASKAALDAMVRTVALEVGPEQTRVNNVSPGIIATPMAIGLLGGRRYQRCAARSCSSSSTTISSSIACCAAHIAAASAASHDGSASVPCSGRPGRGAMSSAAR